MCSLKTSSLEKQEFRWRETGAKQFYDVFFKWGEVTLWELIVALWKRSTELHIHIWFHPLNPSMNNVYMYELFMQLSWWENLWKYSLVNFMTLVFSLSTSTRISFKCWPSYQLPFIIVLSFLSVSFEIL